MKNLLDKKGLFTILLLIVLTFVLNKLIFSNQLNYGFRDVDWQVLYYFKLFGNLSLEHLLKEIKVLGIYVTESYYVGLLEKFVGLNFTNLHNITHFFKIVSALSVYAMILIVFKRKLLAFITSLIYTISFPHAGALFQLSTGGYFLTTIFMNSFFCLYYCAVSNKNILKWAILASLLLIITMFLKPERMYPLIPIVLIIEFGLLVLERFRKDLLKDSLKRTFFVLAPVLMLYFSFRAVFTEGVPVGFAPNQFFIGTGVKLFSILNGNLQLLIEPLSSLGSMFLFNDYLKLLGQLDFRNFAVYITSLIFNPILRLGLITFILFSIFDRKSFRLVFFIMITIFIFGLLIYALKINWQYMDMTSRIHFDPNMIALPTLLGLYILLIAVILFIKWLKSRAQALLSLIFGIGFTLISIILTWISSDVNLIFMGPQRYLSIPSIGTSLFISGLFMMVFDRLRETKFTKQFSWSLFLVLIPLIIINFHVANKFFDEELKFAGVRGSDQIRLKNKFREFIKDISYDDRSLFYFDETADSSNAYFNEGVIIAGFEYWIKVNSDGTFNNFPEPDTLRTSRQCPEHTHTNCLKLIKEGIKIENGEKGIWYANTIKSSTPYFYKLKNFYAFRFINKDIYDIREEVLKEID